MIDGTDILYRDYIDISVAVATPKVSNNGQWSVVWYTYIVVPCHVMSSHCHVMSCIQGLVVPVLRNVEAMNYADIEKTTAELGAKVSFHVHTTILPPSRKQ